MQNISKEWQERFLESELAEEKKKQGKHQTAGQ